MEAEALNIPAVIAGAVAGFAFGAVINRLSAAAAQLVFYIFRKVEYCNSSN